MPEAEAEPTHDVSWRGTTTTGSIAMLSLIASMRERIELLEVQMDQLMRERSRSAGDHAAEAVTDVLRVERKVKRKPLPPAPGLRPVSPDTGSRDGESIDIRIAVLRCDTCTMEYPLSGNKAGANLHNHTVRKHQRQPTTAERTPRKAR